MKILMYDHGLCTECAVTLANAGHDVALFVPNDDAFPKPTKALIGHGLPGIDRIPDSDWQEAFDRADMVFCPDTRSRKIVDLCRSVHKPVWGAGEAERMELDRVFMKKQMETLGMKRIPYRAVKGIEPLIELLKKEDNLWVKVSSGEYRGVIETFHHSTWNSTQAQVLGQLLIDFGADAAEIEFIVEHPIKGAEIGGDYFWVRGERVGNGYGYECKDEAYIGTCAVDRPFPYVLDTVDEKMRKCPLAKNATSFISTEVMSGILLDPTIRAPHPPLAGMLELYPSFPLLVTQSAHTRPAHLQPCEKYMAVLVIRSEWADDHWTELTFPDRLRRWVKLVWTYAKDGHYYALPGNSFVAYAVGLGNTVQSAATAAKKVAEQFDCREKVTRPNALDELIEKSIPEGRNEGIPF